MKPAASALVALALAGCASTQVETQWSDPQFQGRSLRGSKVFVLCRADDLALRHQCEDEIVAHLVAAGVGALPGGDVDGAGMATPEQVLGAARAAGAQTVLGLGVAPGAAVVHPGPQIGFGIGGFSGGYGGGTSGGVGVSVPVGASVQTAYIANGTLVDTASGKLMWTARASAPPSSDPSRQLEELTRAVIGSVQRAGLL